MKIKYPITEVLSALRNNLQSHDAELKEAMSRWTEQVIIALHELSDAVNRFGVEASNNKLVQLFYNKPKDVRVQYSKYIGMLQRAAQHGEKLVELDDEEYDRFFNDNWEWATAAKVANTAYTRH